MKWSLKIAQVAGIGIYVHWTFLILLVWLVSAHAMSGESAGAAAQGIALVIALFACVVLHELGHALTAQRFGVTTRDITLLPIGGVARLERIPEEPLQEFWVAIAGPAVNVAIAAVLFVVLSVWGQFHAPSRIDLIGAPLLESLMWINVVLVVFNMLPAFPMDGGRVLRSLLTAWMPRVRATHIAATVGQGMAILFGVAGLVTGHWMLLFIALFVYLGAQGEAQAVEMQSIFRGVPVQQAMATRFETLSADDPIQRAIDELLAGHQQDFPVTDGHEILGIAFRSDILKALADADTGQRVGDALCSDCPVLDVSESLERASRQMQEAGCSTALVTERGQLVGLLTSENLGEWAMIQSALRQRSEPK